MGKKSLLLRGLFVLNSSGQLQIPLPDEKPLMSFSLLVTNITSIVVITSCVIRSWFTH